MKRILIITGASSGLGREFAFQIAKERAADEIWLLARRKDKLESLALEMAGPKPRVIEMDLGGRKGIAAFSEILEKERRANVDGGIIIDTLVNNAGFGTYGPFAGTDLERQLDMIDLNVLTLTGLCHAALPYMEKDSLIINVASLASFIPLGNFAVYAATKAYVLSFSTALAAEVADDGIFVSTVCPGPVDSEFANVASRGARERVVDGRNPADVVSHCLRQIRRKRHSAIMAPKWKFKAFMSRFVGRYFFARHSFVHDKRPSK
jgi:short-subunit dehydrogenase